MKGIGSVPIKGTVIFSSSFYVYCGDKLKLGCARWYFLLATTDFMPREDMLLVILPTRSMPSGEKREMSVSFKFNFSATILVKSATVLEASTLTENLLLE